MPTDSALPCCALIRYPLKMPPHFQPDLDPTSRHLAWGLLKTILTSTNPQANLIKHFDSTLFTHPTHILAFGKASIPMTNAAIECLGDHFAHATVISTPQLCAQAQFGHNRIELLAADHPLPTQRNINATNRLIEHAQSIPRNHQTLILISGGGSALLCSPKEDITLERLIQTTNALLKSGAPIQEINQTRAQLETLKSGGLARILDHVARIDALVLSDVIGDDITTIASGPVAVPSIPHTIIASNQRALDTLIAWIANERINLVNIQRQATGHAAEQGKALADKLINSDSHPPFAACLGGEPTVDAQSSTGTGGPMLELALAGALELARTDFRWTIITFATDGVDGPTDAAGAIITNDMLRPEHIPSIQNALDEHNALPMCDLLGSTIRTGETGTNVNDLAVAIRWDRACLPCNLPPYSALPLC